MNTEQPKLIVTKEWAKGRLLVLFMLILGIGAGVLATLSFRSLTPKATSLLPSPTPLVATPVPVPSPQKELKEPYMRLVSQKTTAGFSTEVPIEVYLATGSTKTIEATVAIVYDEDLFEISEDGIKEEKVYPVIDIAEVEPGKVLLVFFSNTQSGQKPVSLEKETKIATLMFKTKTLEEKEAEISLTYKKNSVKDTSLIEATDKPQDKPVNLLNSVEGVTLAIEP